MKLTGCPSVQIGQKAYTLADMARHVVRNDRTYNRDATAAREGVRVLRAIEGDADLTPEELTRFAAVIERPSCGWAEVTTTIKIPRPNGAVVEHKQRVHVPASEFLPIIDFVQQAATKS